MSTVLNRANRNVAKMRYGANPWEYFDAWWPPGWDTVGYSLRPPWCWKQGGLGYNPGCLAMEPSPSGGLLHDLMFETGYPVFSVSVPPVTSNADPKQIPIGYGLWPRPVRSLARFVQFLKEHWNDPAVCGVNGSGVANSLDVSKIVGHGLSDGGTLWLMLSLTPPGGFPISGPYDRYLDGPPLDNDHTIRAVVATQPQIDYTQYTFDETITAGGDVYANNIMQLVMHPKEGRVWGGQYDPGAPAVITNPPNQTPLKDKQAMSPWFMLELGKSAMRQTAIYTSYDAQSTNSWDNMLTYQDWSPNSQRYRRDQGKLFANPHHMFQGEMWDRALKQYGFVRRTRWGNNTDNPPGGSTSGVNVNNASPIRDDVKNWLVNTLGFPVYA